LAELKTPSLILQGERDPFGKRDEVAGYGLPKSIKVGFVSDGDHDLKPGKASGRTRAGNWMDAADRMVVFIGRL
jgi:predicted alpha/beta-hydrolase family hydrolase